MFQQSNRHMMLFDTTLSILCVLLSNGFKYSTEYISASVVSMRQLHPNPDFFTCIFIYTVPFPSSIFNLSPTASIILPFLSYILIRSLRDCVSFFVCVYLSLALLWSMRSTLWPDRPFFPPVSCLLLLSVLRASECSQGKGSDVSEENYNSKKEDGSIWKLKYVWYSNYSLKTISWRSSTCPSCTCIEWGGGDHHVTQTLLDSDRPCWPLRATDPLSLWRRGQDGWQCRGR